MKKVRTHPSQNEPLIFERSSPGKKGYQLPPLDVPVADPNVVLGAANVRSEIPGFPEVSEVGIARPGDFDVDVMHLNLHKTFSTPHGGGGPGAGPVAVKAELEPYLPIPCLTERDGRLAHDYDRPKTIGRVRALAYILADGGDGLRNATLDALLNANYIRHGLEDHFKLPYNEPSMHECVFSDDHRRHESQDRRHRQTSD